MKLVHKEWKTVENKEKKNWANFIHSFNLSHQIRLYSENCLLIDMLMSLFQLQLLWMQCNAMWKEKISSIRAYKWHLRQVVSLRRSIQIRVEFQSIPCLVGCMVPRWSIQWLHCCQRLHRRLIHAECLFQCLHLVWHSQCISKDWQKKKNDEINTSHFEWNESADYDTYLTIKQWRLLKCSENCK